MPRRPLRVALLLGLLLELSVLAGCGGAPRLDAEAGGTSAAIECVPYARQASGIQLYGDAAAWWDEAAGRYPRTGQPQPGAVLVFRRSARLPHGHVSVVTRVDGARDITVTQANWVHHRIAAAEPVVDVSAANDWTAVRVWWAPAHSLGVTVYPAYGFVGPATSAAAAMDRTAAN
jgi:surface antigen